MIDLALKSGVLTAFGWLVACGLRRSSAATRYLILTLTTFALAFLPLLLVTLPQWHAPFVRIEVPAQSALPEVQVASQTQPIPWLAISWLFGALLLGARLLALMVRLAIKRSQLAPVTDARLLELAAECTAGHRRRIDLMVGSAGDPPMTWGFIKPTLVLPDEAREWSDDRVRSVLLHEMAHIDRGDWLTNLVSEAVCAVYWPNPLVWMIAKAMARESERAADDRVLNRGLRASQYATHILDLLRESQREAPTGSLAMARPAGLDGRVRAILSDAACRRPVKGFAALGLIVGCAMIASFVGAAAPTIVRRFEPIDAGHYVATNLIEDTAPTPGGQEEAPMPAEASEAVSSNLMSTGISEGTVTNHSSPHPRVRMRPAPRSEAPIAPVAPALPEEDMRDDESDHESADRENVAKQIEADVDSKDVQKQVDKALKLGAEEYRKAMTLAEKEIRASLKEVKFDADIAPIQKSAVHQALRSAHAAVSVALGQESRARKSQPNNPDEGDHSPPGDEP